MFNFKSFVLVCLGIFFISPDGWAEPAAFKEARIFIEQNSTDGDEEVIIVVDCGDKGLRWLSIVTPDGTKIINVEGRDAAGRGLCEFLIESPEQTIVEPDVQAYPQGIYIFTGEAMDGSMFESKIALSRDIPKAPDLTAIIRNGLIHLSWSASSSADNYIVEIENETFDFLMSVTIPGSAILFDVPAAMLTGTGNYKIGLGRVNQYGNINVTDIEIVIR